MENINLLACRSFGRSKAVPPFYINIDFFVNFVNLTRMLFHEDCFLLLVILVRQLTFHLIYNHRYFDKEIHNGLNRRPLRTLYRKYRQDNLE